MDMVQWAWAMQGNYNVPHFTYRITVVKYVSKWTNPSWFYNYNNFGLEQDDESKQILL